MNKSCQQLVLITPGHSGASGKGLSVAQSHSVSIQSCSNWHRVGDGLVQPEMLRNWTSFSFSGVPRSHKRDQINLMVK